MDTTLKKISRHCGEPRFGLDIGSHRIPELKLKQEIQDTQRLNTLFHDIIEKISINENQEMLDVQSAVLMMLNNVKERLNKRGVFNISYIQPCGSMVEKTAIWKCDQSCRNLYIEFDFLAVLRNDTVSIFGNECQGCYRVSNSPVNMELLRSLYSSLDASLQSCMNDIRVFDNLFIQDVINSVISSRHCLSADFKDSSYEGLYRKFSINTCILRETCCQMCSVEMPTGRLRVHTDIDIDIDTPPSNCSLVFLWESRLKTLTAPLDLFLDKTEPVKNLTIYVDFIPALAVCKLGSFDRVIELEHETFIVPKRCAWRNTCENRAVDGAWRISSCLIEIDHMSKLDTNHRKSYRFVKFLCQIMANTYTFGFYPVNRYHVKIIALNHCRTCSSVCYRNCADCVLEMLADLQAVYTSGNLDAFRHIHRAPATCISSFQSLFHGSGVPSFENARFRNLIDSIRSAANADTVDEFVKHIMK